MEMTHVTCRPSTCRGSRSGFRHASRSVGFGRLLLDRPQQNYLDDSNRREDRRGNQNRVSDKVGRVTGPFNGVRRLKRICHLKFFGRRRVLPKSSAAKDSSSSAFPISIYLCKIQALGLVGPGRVWGPRCTPPPMIKPGAQPARPPARRRSTPHQGLSKWTSISHTSSHRVSMGTVDGDKVVVPWGV